MKSEAREWMRALALWSCGIAIVSCGFVVSPACAEGSGWRPFVEFGGLKFQNDDNGLYKHAGLRVSSLDPGGLGGEFAVHALLVPALVATTDLGFTSPIALGPDARLVPRAGGSLLGVVGGEFGVVTPGAYAGLGLVFGVAAPVTFRVDYTARFFLHEELRDDGPMSDLTIGLAWKMRPAR